LQPLNRLSHDLDQSTGSRLRETTQAEAHQAGLNYIEQVLRLNRYADYRWTGSKPHPTMSGMNVFSYSYEA
jgi:hypothetical protein